MEDEDLDHYAESLVDDEPSPPPSRGRGHLASEPVTLLSMEASWSALRGRLIALGHDRLAQGIPELRGRTLRIALASGITLAKAKRSRDQAEVQGLLRAAFPGVEQVELVPTAETATPEEASAALRREVLDDPDCQRIIGRLSAELESVTNLRET
jgi:hypothetical protein